MNCFLCQVNVNQGTNKVKRRKLSGSTTQNVRDILEKFSWDSYGCIIPIGKESYICYKCKQRVESLPSLLDKASDCFSLSFNPNFPAAKSKAFFSFDILFSFHTCNVLFIDTPSRKAVPHLTDTLRSSVSRTNRSTSVHQTLFSFRRRGWLRETSFEYANTPVCASCWNSQDNSLFQYLPRWQLSKSDKKV